MVSRLIGVLVAALVINTVFSAKAVADNIVRVGGAGCGLAVMQRLATVFEKSHPGTKIKVMPNLGSSGGVKALLNGAVDVAISGRALKKDEITGGAVAVECARSPFAIIANRSVNKTDLTTPELEMIYKGQVVKWPNGNRIRMVLRPDCDTDAWIVKSISKGIEQGYSAANTRKDVMVEVTDQDAARAVEKVPDSFSWATLMQVQGEELPVKTLSFNGVRPTLDAVTNGKYPLTKPLYLVTTSKSSSSSLQFVQFVLSPKGRAILARSGAVPVSADKGSK